MTEPLNLLAYGPVTTPVNGFTGTVDADGSLLVSGGEGLAKGKGVAWRLDASRFTPGRYRLGLYGDAWTVPNAYMAVWSAQIGSADSFRLGYVDTGKRGAEFDLTADHIRRGLLFGFCRRLSGDDTGFGPVRVRACLTPVGGVPGEWVKPDDITAVGGELDDWSDNLFIPPPLPASSNGIAFTRVDGHTVHAQGTGTSSFGWPAVGGSVKLEAGEYSLASSTGSDMTNVYPSVTAPNVQGSPAYLMYRPGDQAGIPDTGTLTAGLYRCILRARPGVPINADITPILLKTK